VEHISELVTSDSDRISWSGEAGFTVQIGDRDRGVVMVNERGAGANGYSEVVLAVWAGGRVLDSVVASVSIRRACWHVARLFFG